MKNFVATILAMLLISPSCNFQNESTLAQDPLIQKVFSQSEIQSLEKILELYQHKILSDFPDENNFILALKKHLKDLCDSINVAGDLLQNNYTEDSCQDIFNVMKETGLYDLFYPADTFFVNPITGRMSNFKRTDSICISHSILPIGKYADYLKELSSIDTIYGYHYDLLTGFGGIPPSVK